MKSIKIVLASTLLLTFMAAPAIAEHPGQPGYGRPGSESDPLAQAKRKTMGAMSDIQLNAFVQAKFKLQSAMNNLASIGGQGPLKRQATYSLSDAVSKVQLLQYQGTGRVGHGHGYRGGYGQPGYSQPGYGYGNGYGRDRSSARYLKRQAVRSAQSAVYTLSQMIAKRGSGGGQGGGGYASNIGSTGYFSKNYAETKTLFVNNYQGNFRALKVMAYGDSLFIKQIKVNFANGRSQYAFDISLSENQSTVVDLNGYQGRKITSIQITATSSTLWGTKASAKVEGLK